MSAFLLASLTYSALNPVSRAIVLLASISPASLAHAPLARFRVALSFRYPQGLTPNPTRCEKFCVVGSLPTSAS